MKAFLFHSSALRILTPAVLILMVSGARADDPKLGDGKPTFRTEKVVRDKLTATVTATGTVEPEEVIDVGAQVAGLIQKFGPADPTKPDGPVVDYCTSVKKGQVLAMIDPTIYQAQLNQAKAALLHAQANLKKSQANRDVLKDTWLQDRAAPNAISAAQIAVDKDAYTAGEADCAVQEAAVAEAEANLKLAQINLDYCSITAPVDGVVIDRRVGVGQTAVASLSAPSLFLIAKDLSKMQVWVSVNEADIGNVHVGQQAMFTVDARPGKDYKGKVLQVRLNASMFQNVVTYIVVVEADNPPLAAPEKGKTASAVDRELLPYLTADVSFAATERENALLVPNAALRWRPQLDQVAPDYQDGYRTYLKRRAAATFTPAADPSYQGPGANDAVYPGTGSAALYPNRSATEVSDTPVDRPAVRYAIVWVEEKGFVRPIRVVTGLTDGKRTEIIRILRDDVLDEGTPVVVGERRAGDDGKNAPAPRKAGDK